MTNKESELYDNIVNNSVATIEELNLARNLLDGPWEYVLNSVLYVRTGYRNWDSYSEEWD